jgi:hypothetical protein
VAGARPVDDGPHVAPRSVDRKQPNGPPASRVESVANAGETPTTETLGFVSPEFVGVGHRLLEHRHRAPAPGAPAVPRDAEQRVEGEVDLREDRPVGAERRRQLEVVDLVVRRMGGADSGEGGGGEDGREGA